ncbi:MAG: hypothetical protein EXR28_15150 [Betaproteobacteria bacterium]|nr:hypothetical protein [Betaproteobacteria bacterium]
MPSASSRKIARRPVTKAATKSRSNKTPTAKASKSASASRTARPAPRRLRLTMLTGDYDIVRALKDGTVKPKGINLVIGDYPGTHHIHNQVATGKACDINEFNGGAYVVMKHHRAEFTSLPVFLHRRFRHSFIYINRARVRYPTDLIGGRIGSNSIGAAANYWMRGYLEDAGVPHRSVTWVIDRQDIAAKQAPADLKIEIAPRGTDTREMLLRGEIDAMIAPTITPMIANGDPRVARLYPNHKEVETDYYRRSGFFPIMHVTTIDSEIVARHPWVVESLTLAFEEAKQLAYVRLANPRNAPLAWCMAEREEELALLGEDPWEYGLSARNQANYGQLVKYVHEQVLTGPCPRLQDLFPKEAFELKLPLPEFHRPSYNF